MNKKLFIAFYLWFLSFILPTSSLHAYILDSFVFPECCTSLAWDNGTLWCSTTSQIMYNMDTTGQIISSFKLPVYSKYPWRVTFDGTYFWVADVFNNQIVKIDSSGSKLFSFEYRKTVGGITYDGEYLWIINSEEYRIDKVDTAGNIIDSIRTPGSHAQSITFDGEYLWVGDYPNIYKMDLSGNVVFVMYYPEGSQQGLAYDGKYLWANVCTDNESRINKLEPDRQTGTNEHFRWAFHANWFESSPALGSDGTIYAGSIDGKFYALNPDGTLKWAFKTVNVSAAPTLGPDGTIYVQSMDQYYHALSPEGQEKWRFRVQGTTRNSPALGKDGTIYAATGWGSLYAFNPDGTLRWELDTGAIGLAIGSDGIIYAGTTSGTLQSIDPTGVINWTCNIRGQIEYPPAIGADGTIYVLEGFRPDGSLYAVSPCGWIKWRLQLKGKVYSSPVIGADGTIYAGTEGHGNVLYAINPDGTQKWSINVEWNISSTPAVGKDGTIFVGVADRIAAISSAGELKWVFFTGGTILSSPVIGPDGTLYFGSNDGNLYALNTGCGGLAESAWPMYQQNPQHTGRAVVEAPTPDCSLCPAETLLGNDTEKLNFLRVFRDNVLAKSAFGKKFIETYYSNADRVNSFLGNHPVIRESAKKALDLAVPVMNKVIRHTADF